MNMYQIKKQTHEEKVDMYMQVDKEELVKMLISCNNIIETLTQPLQVYHPKDNRMETQTESVNNVKINPTTIIIIFFSGLVTGLMIGWLYWFK